MLGAVAGDIAGSPWEGGVCSPEEFTLFNDTCVFTDDTVLSVAVAEALLYRKPVADTLREWTLDFPSRGYGGGFIDWAHTPGKPAYGSAMNGGAMRVAAVGWLARDISECLVEAKRTAEVTHNHPEGIQGAQAIALAIWLARQKTLSPTEIRGLLPRYVPYDLSASVHDLRGGDGASTWAKDSVPIAIISALESRSWLEAVKNAVSIGGDCDTTACMAGGIAEALYGLPFETALKTITYLPSGMTKIIGEVYRRVGQPLPWADSPATLRQWFSRLIGATA